MSEILKFATAVVYTDDVPATVAFYRRVTGLEPTYYDADLGFALLGEDQAVAIASHEAGMLMLRTATAGRAATGCAGPNSRSGRMMSPPRSK